MYVLGGRSMTKSLRRAETGTPDNRANQQYPLPLFSTNHDARKHHNISVIEVTIVHHLNNNHH